MKQLTLDFYYMNHKQKILFKFIFLKMVYQKISVNVSQQQKKRIENEKESITLIFSYDDLISGEDTLYVTSTQLASIKKAIEKTKGVKITLSKSQVKYNIKNGGFLSLLAGLASRFLPMIATKILPALGLGALSGAASAGVSKAIGNSLSPCQLGKGLYLKKGGNIYKVSCHQGNGFKITPYFGKQFELNKDGIYTGNGLYLKKGDGFLDVLRSIPIIGDIIKLF